MKEVFAKLKIDASDQDIESITVGAEEALKKIQIARDPRTPSKIKLLNYLKNIYTLGNSKLQPVTAAEFQDRYKVFMIGFVGVIRLSTQKGWISPEVSKEIVNLVNDTMSFKDVTKYDIHSANKKLTKNFELIVKMLQSEGMVDGSGNSNV